MKKMVSMLALWLIYSQTFAADQLYPISLDTVSFQVAAKQWVSTQSALLSVNINVTLANADLVKARSDIMGKLAKIALGEWHLLQFDRSQDSSGLEKLFVLAQARVTQNALTNIYKNAKSVSQPGASYEIGGVDFKPSLNEVQEVRSQLRAQLYQLANDELARINKVYVGQNYTLNYLVFSEGDTAPMPFAKTAQMPLGINAMAVTIPSASSVSVSNELVMTAIVQAASNRKQGN